MWQKAMRSLCPDDLNIDPTPHCSTFWNFWSQQLLQHIDHKTPCRQLGLKLTLKLSHLSPEMYYWGLRGWKVRDERISTPYCLLKTRATQFTPFTLSLLLPVQWLLLCEWRTCFPPLIKPVFLSYFCSVLCFEFFFPYKTIDQKRAESNTVYYILTKRCTDSLSIIIRAVWSVRGNMKLLKVSVERLKCPFWSQELT